MNPHTFTLALVGDVSLATYTEALRRLTALLDALAEDIAPGIPVAWRVVPVPEGATP